MHNDAEKFFETGGEINNQILKFHILYDVDIIAKEINIRKDCQ
mgnify:CR=1 FL=1|jgi:hypothetical protein|nr:MAG TPA: hypothetical protein [Bacteriophage sp.]